MKTSRSSNPAYLDHIPWNWLFCFVRGLFFFPLPFFVFRSSEIKKCSQHVFLTRTFSAAFLFSSFFFFLTGQWSRSLSSKPLVFYNQPFSQRCQLVKAPSKAHPVSPESPSRPRCPSDRRATACARFGTIGPRGGKGEQQLVDAEGTGFFFYRINKSWVVENDDVDDSLDWNATEHHGNRVLSKQFMEAQ